MDMEHIEKWVVWVEPEALYEYTMIFYEDSEEGLVAQIGPFLKC